MTSAVDWDEDEDLEDVELSPAASYRREVEKVAQRAERAALAAIVVTRLTPEERVYVTAAVIAGGCELASMLAALYVASVVDEIPVGIPRPATEEARIVTAVLTTFQRDSDPAPAISRLAVTEVATAARQASRTAMRTHAVERYGWELDSSPCEKYRDLASRTYPLSTPATSHPNCTCLPVPVQEDR